MQAPFTKSHTLAALVVASLLASTAHAGSPRSDGPLHGWVLAHDSTSGWFVEAGDGGIDEQQPLGSWLVTSGPLQNSTLPFWPGHGDAVTLGVGYRLRHLCALVTAARANVDLGVWELTLPQDRRASVGDVRVRLLRGAVLWNLFDGASRPRQGHLAGIRRHLDVRIGPAVGWLGADRGRVAAEGRDSLGVARLKTSGSAIYGVEFRGEWALTRRWSVTVDGNLMTRASGVVRTVPLPGSPYGPSSGDEAPALSFAAVDLRL